MAIIGSEDRVIIIIYNHYQMETLEFTLKLQIKVHNAWVLRWLNVKVS